MYFPSLLFAVAAFMGAAYADFIVATEPPVPLSLLPTNLPRASQSSWTSSVFLNAGLSLNALTKSLGSTYQSTLSSISSEVRDFVASASNYSIPAEVTDPSTTATITGKPDWYDALPSDVRSFKEAEWETIKSVASQVIVARLTTTGSTGGAMPTAHPGLVNAGWAVAAGAAAAFL